MSIQYTIHVSLTGFSSGALLTGRSDLTTLSAAPIWIGGAEFPLRVLFLDTTDPATTPYPATALPTGWALLIGAKSDLSETSFLFSTDTFAETTESADTLYTATLDLNTVALDAALAALPATSPGLPVTLDLLLTAPGLRLPLPQFAALIKPPVATGGEGVPTSGDPPYPTPSEIARRNAANTFTETNAFQAITATTITASGAITAPNLPAVHLTLASFRAAPTAAPPRPLLAALCDPANPSLPLFWALTDSDPGADDPAGGKIRPDDYNTSTNPRRWTAKL